jgi:hypothetical protein
MTYPRIVFVSLVAGAAALFACNPELPSEDQYAKDRDIVYGDPSSKKAPKKNSSTGKDGGTSSSSSSSSSGATTSDAGSSVLEAGTIPPPATESCGAETTYDACYNCCDGKHPKGLAAHKAAQQTFGECACEAPALCAAPCALSYCIGGPTQPGSACDNCLNAAALCAGRAKAITDAEPDTAAMYKCADDAKCESKP